MKRADLVQPLAYVGVSILSVGLAFMISLKFVGRTHAQNQTGQAQQQTHAQVGNSAPSAEDQDEESDATKQAQASAQMTNAGISELEGFLEPFIYDIVNRRDPFQPYSEYVPQDEGPSNRPISPAQRFDLDQLKLVGVMWDVKDPKAMFTDPAQEVLVLGRDESIGNKNGYIAAIREGEVVVVEAIRKRGDIIYRTRVLRIER